VKSRPFAEARNYVHKLGLKNREDWKQYCKSGNKPDDIPNSPDNASSYHEFWKGWGDWLGTANVAPSDRVYRPFSEARAFVHNLGLKSSEEWKQYCKSGRKPKDIPSLLTPTMHTLTSGKEWVIGSVSVELQINQKSTGHLLKPEHLYIHLDWKVLKIG
jgi:hypothetical protein